ncbi:putative benzoate 4-monooxygenase cytochrome P450 [Cladophialophora carrionii]|uniref:Putative benzoate 4-monooxygenase cytochrome P450 n=1 Tax=Cladophialophora carrionii TaxID=86049 RepID=A0A1C1CSR7_9EURO|nr:putative benzoate 4-monooxygenase cytochrome P450 [Cladophialophora carrionii]
MLPVYLALLVSTALVVSFLRNHLFHPLRKFPGPFWAAHTDLWRVYHLWTRRMPDTLLKMHEKYGPVVRMAPNELSFQSVDIFSDVYKGGRKFPKSDFYQGFTTFHPNTFGMLDEELHAKRRRQMAHSFSVASLSQMESIYDAHIKNLLDAIDAKGSEPFNLKDLFGYYAFDIIGELVFHTDFGSQKAQDPAQLPPINEHIFLGCIFGMLPSLLPYSMRIANYLPIPWLQDLLNSRKRLKDRTSECLDREMSRQKTSEKQSILTRLIQAKDPETGEDLPKVAIASEAFAFLVAGSHTTSGTMTLLFYHLLRNEKIGEKLTKELEACIPLPDASDVSLPAYTGLEAQLPYAMASIRENFRITPVFTMPLPRTVTSPTGAVINGFQVPTGTNVSMCNYVVHHDPAVWGDDHHVFRPERWLDPSKPLSPNDLAPFGVGHRACIGRNVATMSIVKILAAVWRRYELELVDPNEELVVESVGIGEKQGPLMVRAKLRTV